MATRRDIVETARLWIGTPFRHQAQLRGVGCDCKGLVVGVAAELAMPEAESLAARTHSYSTHFRGCDLLAGLEATLRRAVEVEPGDIAAILIGRDREPVHLAIVTEPGWGVHAYGGGVRRVAEVPLSRWRVHSWWTWPSLEVTDG